MKRITLFATALLVGVAAALADVTCRGTIVDEEGEPLIGVAVSVPGTTTGTTTDIDGNFTLRVPDKTREIQVEYIGYKTKNVPVAAQVGTIKLDVAAQC